MRIIVLPLTSFIISAILFIISIYLVWTKNFLPLLAFGVGSINFLLVGLVGFIVDRRIQARKNESKEV